MTLICRTCMQKHKKYVSIFNYHENGKMLSDMLVECATINVQKNDGLPVNMCNYCLEKLTSAWNFRELVIETDSKLHNIFSKCIEENVNQNSNTFTGTTVVKEQSDICRSEISNSLIQENVYVNNSRRKQCSPETITSAIIDNDFNFLDKSKLRTRDKALVKNSVNEYNPDKSSNIFTCEDNIAIPELTIKRKGNNGTIKERIALKCNAETNNQMEVVHNGQSASSNLSNSADCCGAENLADKDLGKNSRFLNVDNIEKMQKASADVDETMLVDNSQYYSDESTNNFDLPNENTTEIELGVENVNQKLTKMEREKMSVFCKMCNRSFGYRYYFEIHIKDHSGDKKCKCDICGKTFVRQFQLRIHMAVHTDERPFTCEICGKTFKTTSAISSHKIVVHSADNTQYTCSICQKNFKRKSYLKNHVERHIGEKKYTCEVCGKSFSYSDCFSKHKSTHVDGKAFPCPTCGKKFSTNGSMLRHFRKHSGMRPHSCTHCDKSFKSKNVLNKHILIHTGERPHSCKICHKSFTQSSSLYYHMRIHTGETPYVCKLCPSRFKYSHHLRCHMKVHK